MARKWAAAVKAFEESASLLSSRGDLAGQALAMDLLGAVMLENGQTSAARQAFEGSVAICEQIGDRDSQLHALLALAMMDFDEGRPSAGHLRLEEALLVCEQGGALREAGMVFGVQARVRLDEGDFPVSRSAALKSASAFERHARSADSREERELSLEGQANALLAVAEADRTSGKVGDAHPNYQRAMQIYRQIGNQERELAVSLVYEAMEIAAKPPAKDYSGSRHSAYQYFVVNEQGLFGSAKAKVKKVTGWLNFGLNDFTFSTSSPRAPEPETRIRYRDVADVRERQLGAGWAEVGIEVVTAPAGDALMSHLFLPGLIHNKKVIQFLAFKSATAQLSATGRKDRNRSYVADFLDGGGWWGRSSIEQRLGK